MNPIEARKWAQERKLRLEYGVQLERLQDANAPFLQFDIDQGTADYIAQSAELRHGSVKSWLHRCLRTFLSDFDINGILGTYPMHILSEAQWRTFLNEAREEKDSASLGSLLDVGAGRGDVTSQLAPLFSEVSASETSSAMVKRLKKRGFKAYEGDLVELIETSELKQERFDVISLLNVLDRCDRPLSLLGSARRLLKPNGLLLIALVLPYSPFVYDGPQTRPPKERLPIYQKGFEASTVELLNLALRGLSLEIMSLSRAPYLSGGDADNELYELDDLLVLAKAHGEVSLIL